MWAMGDRDVERIIDQWRERAQAAGEPADADAAVVRWHRRRVLLIATAVIAAAATAAGIVAGLTALRADAGESVEVPAALAGVEPAEQRVSPPPVPATPTADDWFAIMRGVDASRAAAYAQADARLLEDAFDPGGPALAAERARIAALQESGQRAVGWSTELLAVSVASAADERAEVRLRDRRGSYRLVDEQGRAAVVAAADPTDWRLHLVRHERRWLVHEVEPSATSRTGQP